MVRIVVLDGHTLNPGDLSWGELEVLGECAIYPRTPPGKAVNRARDADIIITNKVTLGREAIASLPNLKYVGVSATGYDVVDIQAARERNIPVTNVPTYGTRSVAQMVFAHLLNLTQHVAEHAQTVRDGDWTTSEDWCYWVYPLAELEGMIMGVVGFGRIGRSVAQLAEAFGMRVIAYDVYLKESPDPGVRFVDLDTLFRESDVITLHCPLTTETHRMICEDTLALMKSTAFLINTSRGPVVCTEDLAEALNSGKIAGAGLDVLEVEPPAPEDPLLTAKNCYITPHISWATRSSRQRLMTATVENVRAFLEGKPQNVVN